MRKLIGLSLSLALGLTALAAIPAAGNGPPLRADDCKVNGGANWVIGADAGINYIQVNAKLDKDGAPTGKVHWRQVDAGDQNAKNWVGDVRFIWGNPNGEPVVRLFVETDDGTRFTVHMLDLGEPGAGVDKAWVRLGWLATSPPPVLIENGNLQVTCEPWSV